MHNGLPEIVSTGYFNADFQFKGKEITPNRLVSMYELDLAVEEGGTYFIDDHPYPIKKGVLFISRAGQYRRTKLPFKCLYVHLTAANAEISRLLDALPNQLTLANPDEYARAFSKLMESYNSTHNNRTVFIQRDLFHLLCLLSDSYDVFRQNSAPLNKVIQESLAYIDENFSRDITLSEIADAVHLSKIYFHNLFKKETGETPHTYIVKKRIEKAKKLLSASDSSFTEIAEACGFHSHSYLNCIFKKETGKTLSEYQKLLQSKYPS